MMPSGLLIVANGSTSVARRLPLSVALAYVFIVRASVEWPRMSWTLLRSSPLPIVIVQYVTRRLWMSTLPPYLPSSIPARLHAL